MCIAIISVFFPPCPHRVKQTASSLLEGGLPMILEEHWTFDKASLAENPKVWGEVLSSQAHTAAATTAGVI